MINRKELLLSIKNDATNYESLNEDDKCDEEIIMALLNKQSLLAH